MAIFKNGKPVVQRESSGHSSLEKIDEEKAPVTVVDTYVVDDDDSDVAAHVDATIITKAEDVATQVSISFVLPYINVELLLWH